MFTRRSFLKTAIVAGAAIPGLPSLSTFGEIIDKVNDKLAVEATLNRRKYQFVKADGNIAFTPRYVPGTYFKNGLISTKIGDTQGGYYNQSGKLVIHANCFSVFPFSEGLAYVENWSPVSANHHASSKPETGFIDTTGTMHIRKSRLGINNSKVELGWEFSEGLLPVGINGKYGYIDRTGDIVIEPRFDYATDFHEGLAVVHSGSTCGYINRFGEIAIEPRYATAFDFSEGCAFVNTKKNNMLCIDKRGRMVMDLDMKIEEFTFNVHGPSSGMICVKREGRSCFYHADGNIALEPAYDEVRPYFSEGLVPAAIDGKWGYMNKLGEMVIPPQFDGANDFSEGMAAVRIKERYGFINKHGEMVFEPRFYQAFHFSEGLSLVKLVPDARRG